jgi:hypothetical protein
MESLVKPGSAVQSIVRLLLYADIDDTRAGYA